MGDDFEFDVKDSIDYWDRMAAWYASAYLDSWSRREDRTIARLAMEWLSPTERHVLLDLGCGQGLAASIFPLNGTRLIGVDLSSEMLSYFDFRQSRLAVRGDMVSLPFPDSSFDGAVSLFGSMSYVASLEEALSELARVLRPNGRFLIMLLSRYSLERLIRGNLSKEGMYGSQGASDVGVPARFYTRKVRRLLAERSLQVERVVGMSPWRTNGRLERTLWRTAQALGRVFPESGHAIVLMGRRR